MNLQDSATVNVQIGGRKKDNWPVIVFMLIILKVYFVKIICLEFDTKVYNWGHQEEINASAAIDS